MTHPNLDLIDRFFAAYDNRDHAALRDVLADDATWTFPGHHPLSGTKVGIDAIVAFFDAVGSIMGSSNRRSRSWCWASMSSMSWSASIFAPTGQTVRTLTSSSVCCGHLQTARSCQASTWQQTRMPSTRSIPRS